MHVHMPLMPHRKHTRTLVWQFLLVGGGRGLFLVMVVMVLVLLVPVLLVLGVGHVHCNKHVAMACDGRR